MITKIKALVGKFGGEVLAFILLACAAVYAILSQAAGRKKPIVSKAEEALSKSLKEITNEEEKADTAGINSELTYAELRKWWFDTHSDDSDDTDPH